ncbi:MAG: CorA family divalent cation transporter [Phenylobacterium sp.]
MDEVGGEPLALLWSFSFTQGAGWALNTPALIGDSSGKTWTWSHFRLGDVRARGLLAHAPELPAVVRELFTGTEDRIRIEQSEDWVFGVLPDLQRELGGRSQAEGRLVFAFDPSRLITGRMHPLWAIDDLRRKVEAGERFDLPAKALVEVVEIHVEHVESILDDLAARLAVVEDYVLREPQDPSDTGLSALRRELSHHHRELQSLRGALTRAYAGRQGRRAELLAQWLQEVIPWIEDVDREAAGLQDRGRLLHEEIDTLINGATNRSMRALTVMSTLLIPPTLIVGAFGMNLGGIPFAHSAAGFAWASGLCVAVVAAAVWMLRRMNLLP